MRSNKGDYRYDSNTLLLAATILFFIINSAIAWETVEEKTKLGGKNYRSVSNYIVMFESNTSAMQNRKTSASIAADVESTKRTLRTLFGARIRHTYEHAIHGFSGELSIDAVKYLRRNPRVKYIEKASVARGGTPQGLDRIDQRDKPLDNQYSPPEDGNSIEMYIIDSGIRQNHSDFGGRIASGINFDPDGRSAFNDCVSNGGHGTSVASIAGGSNYGVAKQSNIHSVRVLGCDNKGNTQDIVAGIDHVTAQASATSDPVVANMSIWLSNVSQVLDQAVSNSVAAGVSFVVIAGNGGADACTNSPAKVPEAITVGAINSNDEAPEFSDIGSCVDIYAPGVGIPAAANHGDFSIGSLSGTSAAAPHVAGVVALMLDEKPGLSPMQVQRYIKAAATKSKIPSIYDGTDRILFADVIPSTSKSVSFTYTQDSRAGLISATFYPTEQTCEDLSEGESCTVSIPSNGARIVFDGFGFPSASNLDGCDDADTFRCDIHFGIGENHRDVSYYIFED